MPSIVVIIPFYNGSKWIERALASVFAQTVEANEVIVVNDGSMKEERERLERLRAMYAFAIIDQPNRGQSSARNAGVAATSAEYIAFLDQDDFFLPNHNAELLEICPANDPLLGFVYGDICAADEDGHIVTTRYLARFPANHPKQGRLVDLLRSDLMILPSAALIKRSAFNAVGGFDEQLRGFEDEDLFLRLFRAGYTNYFSERPVTAWCLRADSSGMSPEMERSRMRFLRKWVQLLPDDPVFGNFYFRDALAPRFSRSIRGGLVNAVVSHSPHVEERRRDMRELASIARASPCLSAVHKLQLEIQATLLAYAPAAVLKLALELTG